MKAGKEIHEETVEKSWKIGENKEDK